MSSNINTILKQNFLVKSMNILRLIFLQMKYQFSFLPVVFECVFATTLSPLSTISLLNFHLHVK